jgi:hypothetical protein
MSETKREKFQRMLGVRLPKAVKSIELLQNLSRKSDYEYSTTERREMLDALYDAVDEVADAFGAPPADGAPLADGAAEPEAAPTPGGEVALDQRSEVRWAHDALRRGDKKLAENRLRRVIEAWIAEGG